MPFREVAQMLQGKDTSKDPKSTAPLPVKP